MPFRLLSNFFLHLVANFCLLQYIRFHLKSQDKFFKVLNKKDGIVTEARILEKTGMQERIRSNAGAFSNS